VKKLAKLEYTAMYHANIVSLCSSVDLLLLDNILQERCVVIENTCAEAALSNKVEVTLKKDDPLIVYSGTMNWHPNIDACHYFLDEVFPLIQKEIHNVRFMIVGKNPDDTLLEKIKDIRGASCSGFVKDMESVLKNASVSVVPLRMGSGTRIKILESARLGLPVVSTSKGAEGLEFEEGKDLLIGDTPKQIANHVLHILKDPVDWRYIAENSKMKFMQCYNRTALMAHVEKTLIDQLH
jgi:glycosyltransferase involved in cell wall biosynthesis